MTAAASPGADWAAARRADFVPEARAFASLRRGDPSFRLLRRLLRADEEEIDLVIAKIWCDSHPRAYGPRESLPLAVVKSLLQPFFYLLKRRLARPGPVRADYDIETVDAAYFARWQSRLHALLPGIKRLTPMTRPLGRQDSADPILALITPRTLAWMFLAPLAVPFLLRLSILHGRNLLAPYRLAAGLFAGFEGHFIRWPAGTYLACTDDHNHPCRWLAAKRAGVRLAVLQNGERTIHPIYAFGAMDLYLSFGERARRLAPALGMRVERVEPVGAIYLNGRLEEVGDLGGATKDIDCLFVDQLVWPYNDFDPETGREFENCFRALNELKKRRPDLRVAFQSRHYADPALRELVLSRVRSHFTQPIDILSNDGTGESYRNAARAKVVVTFQSTFGYEAFFAGRGTRALYYNPTHNPYEIYCEDPRFQLVNADGDPGPFVRRIEELLELELAEPPPCARESHAFVDGRVAERIAAALAA